MPAYLVRQLDRQGVPTRYLERRPYDGAFLWLAPWATYATPLTKAAAEAWAEQFRDAGETVQVVEDPCERAAIDDVGAFRDELMARR